ncbi:MAG: hypothetical protein ACO3E9_11465 [Gemmataceae bacterium]
MLRQIVHLLNIEGNFVQQHGVIRVVFDYHWNTLNKELISESKSLWTT